ncbi:MAG: B12-binding domain-containing radical SAM protein [bacterium]|nr:B12-binding domain-containing radical SAM protein [bacterium]
MRIGFLAMSGLRAHDPELLRRGLTLPGLIERGRQVAALPSLGLLSIAACTPPGHELVYAEALAGEFPPELEDCELIAISTLSAQAFEAYAIADRLRASGVRVALGGLHATALPDEAALHADYVVAGEGERAWPEVVRLAERRAAPRVLLADELAPVDVGRLPVPRYDLLGRRRYGRYTVQTVRGCPWRCDFCASTVMLRRPYRKRPVAHVVRDVRAVLREQPDAFLELADDNTFVDRSWGLELCRALEPFKLRWFTETDLSVADDPVLLAAMARAGCRQVLVGLESPDARALRGIEQRSDFKARRATRAIQDVRRIQAHGITVNGCFVLGLDGQDPSIFERVLRCAEEAGLYDVQVTVLTPFPGTPVHARLADEGRILRPGRWDLCTLFDVNVRPAGMTPEQLREGLLWLCDRLYEGDRQRRRRASFRAQVRARICRGDPSVRILPIPTEISARRSEC